MSDAMKLLIGEDRLRPHSGSIRRANSGVRMLQKMNPGGMRTRFQLKHVVTQTAFAISKRYCLQRRPNP
jgi:hypothetical protein